MDSVRDTLAGGFPHSEIRGSELVRSSPRLIAAYHVLHRLSAPRHPPNALRSLDRSHDPCAPLPKEDRHATTTTSDPPALGARKSHPAHAAPKDGTVRYKTRDDRAPPRLAPRRSTIVTYAERARQTDLAIGPVSQTRPSSSRCQTSPSKPKPRGEPLLFHGYSRRHTPAPSASADHLVEPDGIEPTTSCLQSTRSPN